MICRAACIACILLTPAFPQWTQWGGPNGNFTASGKGIADAWPVTGPKQMWKRVLGEGYSGVVAANGTLYTMYSKGAQETVIALEAATGKTKWEYSYSTEGGRLDLSNGQGPHSTPLLLGDRLYTIGIRARMHAFDVKTGRPVWQKDLYKDFPGSTEFDRGYAVSPIPYKDTIVVKLGGSNHAIVALNPKDGSLLWQKHSFGNSPATPVIVNAGGRDVLLTQFAGEVVAMQPGNGELLWSHPHRTDYGLNITPPVLARGNIAVVTSAYSGGARGLQLPTTSGNPTELWKHNRLRVHFTTALAIGDHVYGSSGDFGPAPLTCVEARTGNVVWQDRTFSKANLIQAGDKVILLDEDGTLALVSLSPQGLRVLAKSEHVSLNNSWTPPALDGTTLYVRDRKHLVAIDLR
ncbi:MAG TPA: PQQ-binding-like beta-propeller repeat protein [Bryobacteraceae bacterium]|nr:PQQ-binding-like beta-propeller repeat protein [Bryobacteraceae bacterium]